MLVEDVTAFIEQIDVLDDRKQTSKHRRKVAKAEVEVLEARRDVQVATVALQQLERRASRGADSSLASAGRRFLRGWGGRSPERDIGKVRAHLDAKRNQLTARQKRLVRIERRIPERDAPRQSATMFRLHSEGHYLGFSARRFARLSASQLKAPVLLMRKDGRRWWWYLDRFWWDDGRLSATEIERTVLQSDVRLKQRSDAAARARTILLRAPSAPITEKHLSESVRLAVWRRDSARCVDCGSGESVVFDRILPISQGGSDTAANVELRCQSCCMRLARNEMRTRVSRARLDAAPYYRDERASA